MSRVTNRLAPHAPSTAQLNAVQEKCEPKIIRFNVVQEKHEPKAIRLEVVQEKREPKPVRLSVERKTETRGEGSAGYGAGTLGEV